MGSVSSTNTSSRFALLKIQVLSLLSETCGLSDSVRPSISLGLDKHYIEKVYIRGLFSNDEIGAEICLSIDWQEHALAIAAGGDKLQVPDTWKDDISPSMQEAYMVFNETCQKAVLTKHWMVSYDPIFDRDAVNRELGFVPAPKRQWRQKPYNLSVSLGPLNEASLTVSIGID